MGKPAQITPGLHGFNRNDTAAQRLRASQMLPAPTTVDYNPMKNRELVARAARRTGAGLGMMDYNRILQGLGGTRSAGILQAAPQASQTEGNYLSGTLGAWDLQRGQLGEQTAYANLAQRNQMNLEKYMADQRYRLGLKALAAQQPGWQDVLGAIIGGGGQVLSSIFGGPGGQR